MHFLPFWTIGSIDVMDGSWLDILTLLSVRKSILPRVVCFAMSRPANHATCSYISGSGYANEPIRRCLFIDYIAISVIILGLDSMKRWLKSAYVCEHDNVYIVISANVKVNKGAKIRNRYNQVPHLTQDTNGKVTNSVRHHKREPRGHPFPSRWPQSTYKQTRTKT